MDALLTLIIDYFYKINMTILNKISGKIINHDESFSGEITFNENIQEVKNYHEEKNEKIIIPGFVDLHCHGGNGYDTMDGINSIKSMANFHLSKGTTSLLATTWTNNFESTFSALNNFDINFMNKNNNLIGVHLEGPFINPNKLGAQPPLSQEPSIDFVKKIKKIADVKVITIAPEIKNIDPLIEYLIQENIKIQIGHSLANYQCCKNLIDKTDISFTHLYNAMSGNDHRNPGVVTSALLHGKYSEIICDLNHVSPHLIQLASKNIPYLYAITDAISACGNKDGDYKFAGVEIEKVNDKVFLKNTSTLAGSVVDMHVTFKNLLNIGYENKKAVAMTSYNASKYLNLNNIGKIKKSCKANFLVLDKNYDIIDIYLNGNKYEK
jgi:N-acetylglucosamine-6-phosphate deacetylase|tara:strand:+ start:566 stop:1708 length:1143 start_codon:yes stop_codon:yes gene_type:complete